MITATHDPHGRTMAQLLAPLLSPLEVGTVHSRNRFALAPMTRLKAVQGVPTDVDIDYYRRRAAGGAGIIITEGVLIPDPAAGFSPRIPVLVPEAEQGWRKTIEAVHGEGSAIIAQVWHTGISRGVSSKHNPGVAPKSPSGRNLAGEVVADPMTDEDIAFVITAYAEAAERAQEWGFDGVEIHGAHGYLLDQFLWSRTNTRDDAFGRGTMLGTSLPSEVVKTMRRRVGSDFTIAYRFSQWKADHYRARIAETSSDLEAILRPLVDAGVSMLHPSTRRHWLPEFPDESPMGLAGWTKRITGLPVIAVGSVGIEAVYGAQPAPEADSIFDRLATLSAQFEAGEFDVIAIGRAMLADAAWVEKMLAGRLDEIRPYRKIPETEHLDYDRFY
jgi:2,4-dienoyl-CoA reductase-like NADH-dependent reductase (Old Yellow Enzyme family)